MRDRPVIYTGLILFLGLFSFPMWRDFAARATTKGPQQAIPAREKQCVAPIAYMRSSHMTLLMDWRQQVVRDGNRQFTAADGRTFTRSLTGTCLKQCHGTKADFCDRCHSYAGVSATCWDCHQDVARPVVALSHRGGLR